MSKVEKDKVCWRQDRLVVDYKGIRKKKALCWQLTGTRGVIKVDLEDNKRTAVV